MAADTTSAPLTRAQTIVRICLLLTTAIIVAGAGLQIVRGAAEGDATADHIHRFMAGVYIGWAPLFFWAAATIRSQGVLVYFLAVPVFLGALGRVLSIALNGLPVRPAEFLSFGALEIVIAFVIVWAHSTALRTRRMPAVA
ncbi:DUF4345 domain-containing protein [Streptomyces bicolor]|uniref:DUF4345 domain-containing protein n=1 Tax=Streptomyces bicolor TaxID=66874 RepID=UPI0004E12A0A|nr:DUF4345 domain-containing protein [Streptomyces bicolor]